MVANHILRAGKNMAKLMVSFFDQFPIYNKTEIEVRGRDGYFCATDMSKSMGKRFTDWHKTDFAKRLLARLSLRLHIPIYWSTSSSHDQTPLVDYVRGHGQKQWVHPAVAMSYSMNDPELQADVNAWLYGLMTLGTINPHVLDWTQEEIERGNLFNQEDIDDLYDDSDEAILA